MLWSVVCRSHLATFDTRAYNRPNHFSFAPTAPTLAGASRCHQQIIHAARLGSPSSIFVKHCASVPQAKHPSCLRGGQEGAGIERCRTPSVTDANLLAKAGRSSHLRLITAQLAPSTRCNVTVPATPDYADDIALDAKQPSSIEPRHFPITDATYGEHGHYCECASR